MSNTVKKITVIGMLLAIQVVLCRFVAISLPTVKISFTFLPIVITAMLYGPLWGGAAAVMGDFLIAILGPYGYYPPMAITALLTSLALQLFGSSGVGIATLVSTVVLLIFGEITLWKVSKGLFTRNPSPATPAQWITPTTLP